MRSKIKKSLKRRIDAAFLFIIVITLVLIGIINRIFIDDIYLNNKVNLLVESFERAALVQTEEEKEDFTEFCIGKGLTFITTDSNLYLVASNTNETEAILRTLFGTLLDMEDDNTSVLKSTKQYQIMKFRDKRSGIDYLELLGILDTKGYYMARFPLSDITEAARITFEFYVVVGIIMLLISAIIIRTITKRLTKPIIELNDISNRMAKLDFDARYVSGGEDEIGRLGENMNRMSQSLEESISELKSANARLEKDIEEKVKLEEKRREFLSDVSHELKTPLALIQGYAEGLKEMSQNPESRDYYCDVIIDEAERMNKLVKQLLSLDQLESGRDRLDIVRFDLANMLEGIIASFGYMLEQKKIEVINSVRSPFFVWGDEFKIEQVITNYLSNAVNHCSGDMKIHINAVCRDDTATISVFNTGAPIPEEELDNIWTKFYKIDKARTREYGGSGIGLSIVKAIVQLHRQKCWAQNYENGVAFNFTLSTK